MRFQTYATSGWNRSTTRASAWTLSALTSDDCDLEQVRRDRPAVVEQVVVPDLAQLRDRGRRGRRPGPASGARWSGRGRRAPGPGAHPRPACTPAHSRRSRRAGRGSTGRGSSWGGGTFGTGAIVRVRVGAGFFRRKRRPPGPGPWSASPPGGPAGTLRRRSAGSRLGRRRPGQRPLDRGDLRPEVEVAPDHGGGPPRDRPEVDRPVQDRVQRVGERPRVPLRLEGSGPRGPPTRRSR